MKHCVFVKNKTDGAYYAERGLQTGKEFFASEEAACEYFLTEMMADPTTHMSWKSGFSMLRDTTHE